MSAPSEAAPTIKHLNYPRRPSFSPGDMAGPDMPGQLCEVVEVLPSAADGRTRVAFRPATAIGA